MNSQRCCWLVEAWWWCHGNGSPPAMRRAPWERLHPPQRKTVPRNVSSRQTSLRFQSCGLKHDGYFMLRAVETHFFITSHQNPSRRLVQQACAFNENCGLALRPGFGSAPQGGCVDQRKGQKSTGSGETWSPQNSSVSAQNASAVPPGTTRAPVQVLTWTARPTSPPPVQIQVTEVSQASVQRHPQGLRCTVRTFKVRSIVWTSRENLVILCLSWASLLRSDENHHSQILRPRFHRSGSSRIEPSLVDDSGQQSWIQSLCSWTMTTAMLSGQSLVLLVFKMWINED